MPQSASFAVVIPMFNEESGAEECVRQVCAQLSQLTNRAVLIVVNDGSQDNTAAILHDVSLRHANLKVVTHTRNSGYGSALRTGVLHAQKDGYHYVLFMDSDLTNHPTDVPKFVACMEQGYDVIKATRYSKGGSVSGVPAYRVWISKFANGLAHLLFRLPVRDCTNGFRAVRTGLLVQMELKENRFPVIMEELYWSRFLAKTFAEVPVVLTNRGDHLRPTSFAYRPSVFWNYLKYPLKAFVGVRPKHAPHGQRVVSEGTPGGT